MPTGCSAEGSISWVWVNSGRYVVHHNDLRMTCRIRSEIDRLGKEVEGLKQPHFDADSTYSRANGWGRRQIRPTIRKKR